MRFFVGPTATRRRRRWGALLRLLPVLFGLSVCGCGGGDSTEPAAKPELGRQDRPTPPTLRFSAIPDRRKTELQEKFSALAQYLSEQLDVPCEYVPASDYKASVDAFKNGDIQLAWFGGLTGVQARRAVPGAKAIAQGDSDPKFKSYFIAHVKSGLRPSSNGPPDGLEKRTFAFGSESSTSGRLMPEYFLHQKTGKTADDFFEKTPVFSGSHDKTVELVESGQVEAGVVNFKVYEQRVAEKRTDPTICKIVWTTPEYADYNFTAHPDLDIRYGDGFVDRLQATLIAIDDPELLAAFPRDSLIEARNEDFEGIEAVAEQLGFLR